MKQTCSNWTGEAFLSCHLNVIRQLISHKQVDHKKTFVVVSDTKSESEFKWKKDKVYKAHVILSNCLT